MSESLLTDVTDLSISLLTTLVILAQTLQITGFEKNEKNPITVTPILGGLSNFLYVLENETNKKIIARLSAHTNLPPGSNLIDQTLLLNSLPDSLAPRALGSIENVRFESFVNSLGTLTISEFRSLNFASEIGRVFGVMHLSNSISLFKSPPTLLSRLFTITKLAGKDLLLEAEKLSQRYLTDTEICDADQEIISQVFQSRGCSSNSLIIHGDALYANFLVQSKTIQSPRLSLLDFEYAISAPLIEAIGFEFGNILCEFSFNYETKDAPGYLMLPSTTLPPCNWRNALISGWANEVIGPSGTQIQRDCLERVAHIAAKLGMQHSHLFWSSWSRLIAKESKNSSTVFNYETFSIERLARLKTLIS